MWKFSNLVALAAVLALLACGSASSAGTRPTRHSPSPSRSPSPFPSPSATRLGSAGSPPASPETATTEVTISDFAFHPASVTVKLGGTVNWTEEDADVHNVKFSGADGVTSPVLRKGETFRHTFDAAGTYSYICSIHPYMHGTVVVTS